jgi:hypothetical protein
MRLDLAPLGQAMQTLRGAAIVWTLNPSPARHGTEGAPERRSPGIARRDDLRRFKRKKRCASKGAHAPYLDAASRDISSPKYRISINLGCTIKHSRIEHRKTHPRYSHRFYRGDEIHRLDIDFRSSYCVGPIAVHRRLGIADSNHTRIARRGGKHCFAVTGSRI